MVELVVVIQVSLLLMFCVYCLLWCCLVCSVIVVVVVVGLLEGVVKVCWEVVCFCRWVSLERLDCSWCMVVWVMDEDVI